jgi:hypothetical protein
MSGAERPSTRTFGIGLGELFMAGVDGYRRNFVILSLAGTLTLSTYLAFRLYAQAALADGHIARSIVLDLAGMILASVVALPWYSYALDADRALTVDTAKPFRSIGLFAPQAVASFWFWAAFLFGLRYLYGVPSLLALVFYAFYGYIVAEGRVSGLRALGVSARLGEGRRVGLFAVGLIFLVFNFFGAIALGFSVTPLTVLLAFVGVLITANITLVAGARLYRSFSKDVR